MVLILYSHFHFWLICSVFSQFSPREHTKDTLVECVSSHIKQGDLASMYGARLDSSSGRILLQSVPGLLLTRKCIACFGFVVLLYQTIQLARKEGSIMI